MKIKKLLPIALCFLASFSYSQIKSLASLKKQVSEDKEITDPWALYRIAYFEGRPAKAGSDVASTSENVIPKKETFEAKIARYKKSGYKIGVAYSSGPITTKAVPPPSASGSSLSSSGQMKLKGALPSQEQELRVLAEDFTKKMNAAFNTDIFEMVDLKSIPSRKTLGQDADDWWATNYKTVFNYSITPEFDYNSSMGKYNGDYVATCSVSGMEYYLKKGKPKMSILVGGKAAAHYKKAYSEEKPMEITTIQELDAIVQPPSTSELVNILLKDQEIAFKKVVDKLNK